MSKVMEQELIHTLPSNDEDVITEIRQEGTEIVDGIAIDGMGDTDTSEIIKLQRSIDQYKEDVFWYSDNNGTKPKLMFDNKRLLKWLGKKGGFSLLREGKSKTSSFCEISLRNGILDKEDRDSMRKYIFEYFEGQPSRLWDDENAFGVFKQGKSGDMWCKLEVINKLFNHSFNQNTFGYNVKVVWKDYNYKTLPTLTDDTNNVYLPFNNKVVHITKNNIKMIDYDDIKSKGHIWKSQIIDDHDITPKMNKNEGLFEKFCRLATSKRIGIALPKDKDWIYGYTSNDDVFKSLKTAYGYMISGYNNPSRPVAPIFIDGGAEVGMEDGRNGKSVVMGSIRQWKRVAYQSGKSYQSIKSSGGRFQYSNVDIDTKFVWINDTAKWFDMEEIYDRLSDDFEVGGKFQDKFVIPQDKKPKMGICTNYPPKEKGGSATYRMHITPFGDYFLNVNIHKESPSDKKHLGKMLFEHDFTTEDKNDFYWFGFECVQLYLNEGLHRCNTDMIKMKRLITKWEDGVDDGVVRWFINVVENEEIIEMTTGHGIPKKQLHRKLCESLKGNPMVQLKWASKEKRFNQMVFDVCRSMGYKYNEDKSHMGSSAYDRRILQRDKKTGKNVEYICIHK